MKSIAYEEYGGIDKLKILDQPVPKLKKDHALVKIHSIGLNPRDAATREGQFKVFTGKKFPKLTGADFSGVITEVNDGSGKFKVGDEVFGYYESIMGGVSAEITSIPCKYMEHKPGALSHVEAAATGCTYLTALQGLRDIGKATTGERLLLYGASGGVGTAAIHLGKYFGLHVVAVSHSLNKDYCLEQGADAFISYDQTDIFSIDNQFDIFFQVFSREGFVYGRAKRMLNRSGRFICLIPNPLHSLKHFFSRPRYFNVMVKAKQDDLSFLSNLMVKKEIIPHVDHIFDIEDYKKAYTELESGKVKGKSIIRFT